jgi:hypothetical protein
VLVGIAVDIRFWTQQSDGKPFIITPSNQIVFQMANEKCQLEIGK